MDQSIKLFVVLGTQKFPFNRLIQSIEKLILDGFYNKEEVLIQSGFIENEQRNINIVNSIPFEKFNSIIQKAEIVITHAGVNSILTCMRFNKNFIIIPRLKQYREHVDNHQLEIAEVMENKFDVIILKDINQLSTLIDKASTHKYKQWNSNNTMLIESISSFLKE